MVLFILAIIIFVVGVIGVGLATVNMDEKFFSGFQLIPAFIAIVLLIVSCIKTVPTGYTGIVTTFGRVESQTLDAGISFMKPWQKVVKMDNRVQKAQIELSCFSSDIQEVKVVYTVNYQISKTNAQDIYRTVGTGYYDAIITPRCIEAVKAGFAKYTAESLIADRNVVAQMIEDTLTTDLATYNIELVNTAIEDVDFSDKFTDAAEAKVTAQQEKLTAQTQQETATLEAQAAADRDIIKAQADAEIVKIQAESAEYQGQKDAAIMEQLGRMIQQYPGLVEYYYATNWDGKLPETMLGNDTSVLFNK